MKKGLVLIRRWYTTGPILIALIAALVPGTFFAEPGTRPDGADGRSEPEASAMSQTPAVIIRQWPPTSRGLAGALIEKYGDPDLFGETAMIWYGKGTWKSTIAYRDAGPRWEGTNRAYHLKQSILYQVPDDKIAALRRFDRRITVDKELRMVSAQSESEAMNYLALNLAQEIAVGKRSVEDAREFRRRTQALAKAGKSVPYLNGFVFALEKEGGG